MTDDLLSRLMFWVGLMFVVTPLLIVATVVLATRHLRKKRGGHAPGQPTGRKA